jgi:hypothetical protein
MKLWRGIPVAIVFALLFPVARTARADDDPTADDEKLVKAAGVGVEAPALLEFFRKRTLTDEDFKRFAALVKQLGDDDFDKREEASGELSKRGTAVLPLLRKAAQSSDAEVSRRAADCITRIEKGPGAALPVACARLLARKPHADAAAVLLAHLPQADDGDVEQAVFEALLVLSARADAAAALRAALKDEVPVRRAAAAFVLGRSADKDVRDLAKPLLADKSTMVRFRAAQSLIAANDKAGVPALVELVTNAKASELGEVEELLDRLGGDFVPDAPTGDSDEARKKRRDAWDKWWKDKGDALDLAKANAAEPFLGLTVMPEMHANKVWECGKDGKARWTIADLQCPIDAQVLPGGRLLVAEINGNKVTERDRDGKVLWQHAFNTPIYCQRLPNGNTFISSNDRFVVVNREGKEVMSYAPPEMGSFFMHSVQRLKNGHVIIVSTDGQVREVDAAFKEVRTLKLDIQGGWDGITGTPNGNYLVTNGQGVVQEIDKAGKKVWEHKLPGAVYASRLPNGNTLIVSNTTGLHEVTKDGKTVWTREMPTALWRAHRR